LVPFNVNY